MTPERWRKVEDIYHAVSDRPSADRPPLLDELCLDDGALRHEVEELLEQSEEHGSLLDRPGPRLLDQTELEQGQALGPYRIVKLLGIGGMGRVYQATDTRLGRSVAIKVSRGGFTGRFRREARAVAALNHPHICTLYDLGPNYLVMEHVEGEPVRGPMPLPQALKVAIAIADALDAAHRKGVIHRDLKPANILLTESGPKLLDFGLAKLEAGAAAALPDSMSLSVAAQATIAGTMQYMSPEQLQGRGADARSDIFSFGLVLFEMLTGRPAFEADNAASLIAAILTTHPHARRFVPDLPPELDRLLERALAKDPEDRWQSARDLKAALEWIVTPPVPTAPAPPARASRLPWIVAAGFALISGALAWIQWRPALAPSEPPLEAAQISRTPQLTMYDRQGQITGTVGGPADYSNPTWSPDGKRLAVAIRDSSRLRDIWVFDLALATQSRLTSDPADETNPVWSPDGSEIVYCSERLGQRDLYLRTSSGGPERVLFKSNVNKNPLDWSRDGKAIYYNVDRAEGGHDIWRLPLDGKEPKPRAFLKVKENRDWLAISPDSKWMLFRVGGAPGNRTMLRSVDGSAPGEWQVGMPGTTEGHWRQDGAEFYYIAQRTMMAQPVRVERGTIRLGAAKPLFRVPTPYDFGRNAFTVSPDGQRFVLRTGT